MIKAKQILKICEVWLKRIPVRNDTFDVYENPTSSDLVKMYASVRSGDFRYIADAINKNVYVWDANMMIHGQVKNQLNLSDKDRQQPNLYLGYCKLKWGRLLSDNMGDYCYTSPEYKWDWLERYVKGAPELIRKQSSHNLHGIAKF